MSKLVLYSRLGLLVSLVLMAIYYLFRREIRPDMTFTIRVGLHLLVVAFSVAVVLAPVLSHRASQIYSAVITDQQQAAAHNEPLRNKILRMPRVGMLVVGLGVLVTGTVWAAVVDDDFLSNAPGWLSGVGAVLCAVTMLGV
jgi:hypothetical protein